MGANLTVEGDAHLILCDGATLAISNPGEDNAGVKVPEDASLVIYGQTSGTGVLTATGGFGGAGIGGGMGSAGAVTINGGTVTATGGQYGAGIGGKAYLGVSVSTNAEVKVEGEGEDGGWEKAKIEGAKVEDDGTVTLTVPATAEKGFMILKSKAAK